MIEKQILEFQNRAKEQFIPTITTWKGVKMIRVHSFLAAVHEMINYIQKLDYVKIGIIGDQNTGKTTLAKALGHVLHKMAEKDLKIPFQIKIFSRHELLNFRETLANLNPANYILIFDDISFLHEATPKQLAEIKSAVTMIRHMKGGQDVKIVEIDDYHYTKGHDKYLRQSHFKLFTSIGSEETQNVISMTDAKYANRIVKFQQLQAKLLNDGFFKFNLGNKGPPFTYKYRDPFIPVLFWNKTNLRIIVSPTREWMDRTCSICAVAENRLDVEFDYDKYKIQMDDKHGIGIMTQAIKLKLFSLGLNAYKSTLNRALYELDKSLHDNNMDIRILGQKYGLEQSKPTFTRDYKRLFQIKEEKEEKTPYVNNSPDKEFGKIAEW